MASTRKLLAVCLRNEGYEASLEQRKIYAVLPDEEAARHKLLRVIDESGDDYLYPRELFVEIELPVEVERAVLKAAAH